MRPEVFFSIALSASLLGMGCQDKTPPNWPAGAELKADELQAEAASLSWPQAKDDRGVTGYRLLKGSEPLATPTSNSHRVEKLSEVTAYNFSIQARDEAGNWSVPLLLELTTPDGSPPTWPAGSELSHEFGEDSDGQIVLKFSWPLASDNVAVKTYRLKKGKTIVRELPADATGCQFDKSFDPRGDYQLVALDAAGLPSNSLDCKVDTGLNKHLTDRKIAQNAGVLALLSADSSKHQIGSIFGSSSLGDESLNALGGLRGGAFGDAGGFGDLGTRGTGLGGGGSAAGMGGLGTRGYGGNIREPKLKVAGQVRIAGIEISGPIDRAEVDIVVKRRRGAFEACYEKRLSADDSLSGTLEFQLTIEDGKVVGAAHRAGSLQDQGAQKCILRVLKRLRISTGSGKIDLSLTLSKG